MATALRGADRPMTAEALADLGEERAELVEGELVMMTPAFGDHGSVTVRIVRAIGNWADEHGAGEVFDGQTGFILARNPDTVRAPDVAFVARHRVPPRLRAFLELAPDLAVEVLSSSDSVRATMRRLGDYLRAGTRLVWLVDPESRSVGVLTGDAPMLPTWIEEGGMLDGGDVLPGLALPVAQLFVGLPREAAPPPPSAPAEQEPPRV